jgi:hypothetical protein
VLTESIFNLPKLHAISAYLYHMIQAPKEIESALRKHPHTIASSVDGFEEVRVKRILNHGLGGALRESPVPKHHAGTFDKEFPFLIDTCRCPVIRQREHLDIGTGLSEREFLHPLGDWTGNWIVGADIRFGRTIEVEEFGLPKRSHDPAQMLDRKYFSRE